MSDKPIVVKKFNEGLDVERKVAEGGILARIYLGVEGNDLDAAKKALDTMVYDRLSAEPKASLLEVSMYDIMKGKGGRFSGVSEVKLVADDYRWFVNLVMRYGPSAVEIIEPDGVKLDSDKMHSIVADVCDSAHMYSQQILTMFKDPERRALYERMLSRK